MVVKIERSKFRHIRHIQLIINENELRQNGGIIYISGNAEFKGKCSGELEKINMQIFCMVGAQ